MNGTNDIASYKKTLAGLRRNLSTCASFLIPGMIGIGIILNLCEGCSSDSEKTSCAVPARSMTTARTWSEGRSADADSNREAYERLMATIRANQSPRQRRLADDIAAEMVVCSTPAGERLVETINRRIEADYANERRRSAAEDRINALRREQDDRHTAMLLNQTMDQYRAVEAGYEQVNPHNSYLGGYTGDPDLFTKDGKYYHLQ